MPRDANFGPACRRLIEEHGLVDLFTTNTGEAPEGQLYKPPPTPEEVTEKITAFLEDLFDFSSHLLETYSPSGPHRP